MEDAFSVPFILSWLIIYVLKTSFSKTPVIFGAIEFENE